MRFTYEEADNYGGRGGGNSYFSLKGDGDIARVHLLGRDINDFCGYAVHKVAVGDRDRWVNCLREYGDPIDDCPFCASGDPDIKKIHAKMFIPLFNIDADEVQVWERGKSFFKDMSSYCARYGSGEGVVSVVTEIERLGAKGDTSTRYNLIKVDDSDARLSDFEDEMPEIIGRYVLDKTAEEMDYYLDKGHFKGDNNNDGEVRRRESETRNEANRRSERDSDERSSRSESARRTTVRSARRSRTEEDNY